MMRWKHKAALVVGLLLVMFALAGVTRDVFSYGCNEVCVEGNLFCPDGYCFPPGTHGLSSYHWFVTETARDSCVNYQSGGCEMAPPYKGCKCNVYIGSTTGCQGKYTDMTLVSYFQICI